MKRRLDAFMLGHRYFGIGFLEDPLRLTLGGSGRLPSVIFMSGHSPSFGDSRGGLLGPTVKVSSCFSVTAIEYLPVVTAPAIDPPGWLTVTCNGIAVHHFAHRAHRG